MHFLGQIQEAFSTTSLFLASFCVLTSVHAQQKSQVVFHFTNGFIYGQNDPQFFLSIILAAG